MINTCNKIIAQDFKIILRVDTHFEVTKESIKIENFQPKQYGVTIYRKLSTKGKSELFLTSKNSCENPSFYIGIGSSKASWGTQWHLLRPS